MARHQERERPMSEEEFEEMPERISDHFDRVREALQDSLNEDAE